MRPFFIANPNSATVKKRGSVLEAIALERDVPFLKTKDTTELDEIIHAAAKQEFNWFSIEGGDGTAQATLSAYMRNRDAFRQPPSFTLLPGGMTNQIARQIGLKRPLKTRMRELLAQAQPVSKLMPMVQVNIPDQTDQFGFLFSTGALPMATRYYFNTLHKDGKVGPGAVTTMIRKGFAGRNREELYHNTPMSLRITGPKEETHISEEHLTSLVTTLPGLMLGLDPFWADGEAPLRLTYVHGNAKKVLRNLLAVWAGLKQKDRTKDGFESWRADVLKYEYEGPVLLDGDPIHAPDHTLYIRATEPVEFWT